ncbi:TPA: hypothetical protein L4G09_005624 [Pseudomonas aeruginosa]|nr:hypothetical protein [Pseudomonas aeruginosa]
MTILGCVVATQKDSDQNYYRSNQEQQDQRATADTLDQPNIFRFSRHFRTPQMDGNEKAPAFARASELPILITRKIGRMGKYSLKRSLIASPTQPLRR